MKKMELQIFGKPVEKLQARLKELVERNDMFSNADKSVFYYKGQKWTPYFFTKPVQGIPSLHPELHEAMDLYIRDYKQVMDIEHPMVLGYLRKILNHCKNPADVIAIIPSALHPSVQDVLDQIEGEVPTLTTEEVSKIVGAEEACLHALQLRMMNNLLEG
jgi:hypothetical protein